MRKTDRYSDPNVITVNDVQVLSISKEWRLVEARDRSEQIIILVIEGRASFRLDQTGGMLNQGDFMVISPQDMQEGLALLPITENIYVCYVALFAAYARKERDGWLINEVMLPIQGKHHIETISLIHHHIEQLHLAWRKDHFDQPTMQILFLKLWQAIMAGVTLQEKKTDRQQLLQGIAEHMEQHCEETFQIEEMARYSGMTPTLFYQQFKEYTSLTPLQFINRKRMEKACQLLVAEDVMIPEVANEAGYRDVYYFSRMFKKIVGVPPYRFKKSLQKKIAVLHPAIIGDLLALGVSIQHLIPVWEKHRQKRPYSQMEAATLEFDLYRLHQMEPDLIVGTDQVAPWLEQLEAIAPTLLIPFKTTTWRDHLQQVAAMLGIAEVATSWLYYYDLKAVAARERIRKKIGNETVMAVRAWDGGARIFGAKRRKISDILYGDLQVRPPVGTDHFSFLDIASLDELHDFQADHILLFDERKIRTDVRKHRLKGNVHRAGVYPWLHYSSLGHEQAISEALTHLAESQECTKKESGSSIFLRPQVCDNN
ncbi:helix-turn-helix domain-containing protein [Brevibacillus porteri]|uniref:helix-turn-helix domain-containing protein n=1 Tax=Brevibacillus porteri TaxID=2126350 RepID=UPI003D1A8F3D